MGGGHVRDQGVDLAFEVLAQRLAQQQLGIGECEIHGAGPPCYEGEIVRRAVYASSSPPAEAPASFLRACGVVAGRAGARVEDQQAYDLPHEPALPLHGFG